MGGFGLRSLEVEQGVEALGIITSTCNSTLPTSMLFKQSLEFAQLELGMDKSIFQLEFKRHGVLITKGWIASA